MATRLARMDGPVPFAASILEPPNNGGPEAESALQALLECGETVAQTGSWDWHLDTNQLRWSDNLYRIFGLEPGEITPSQGYVIERAHPYDRARVERQVGSKRTGRLVPLEYRIVRPDGVVRHLRASEAVVEQVGGRPAADRRLRPGHHRLAPRGARDRGPSRRGRGAHRLADASSRAPRACCATSPWPWTAWPGCCGCPTATSSSLTSSGDRARPTSPSSSR